MERPRSLGRRFPFDENKSLVWNKKPRLNVALSLVSRCTDLAFEDMKEIRWIKGRTPSFKKVWDSTLSSLKPAMASTVVARNRGLT